MLQWQTTPYQMSRNSQISDGKSGRYMVRRNHLSRSFMALFQGAPIGTEFPTMGEAKARCEGHEALLTEEKPNVIDIHSLPAALSEWPFELPSGKGPLDAFETDMLEQLFGLGLERLAEARLILPDIRRYAFAPFGGGDVLVVTVARGASGYATLDASCLSLAQWKQDGLTIFAD